MLVIKKTLFFLITLFILFNSIVSAWADIDSGLIWSQKSEITEFNGVNNRINTSFNPASNPNKDFTIAFWANPTKVVPGFYYSAKNSNSQRFYLKIQDAINKGTITLGLSSWNPSFSTAVSADSWQHYVVKLEGTTASIYRNNKKVGSQSGVVVSLPSGNLVIGSDELSSLGSFYSGKIEDFRIYNRALPDEDILAIYDLGGGDSRTRDSIAPSVPTNLKATAASPSQINLTWDASTDNVGVVGYRIYRDGVEITSRAFSPYANSSLAANTSYSYAVVAEDADGNLSLQSATVTIATPPIVNGKTLTIEKIGTGQGTVKATGIDCGLDCSELFITNSNVTITQLADTGSVFAGWRKTACLNSSLPGTCKTSMTSDQTFVAMFGRLASRLGKTLTAASCELSDVQAAINQAQDGDTVQIPAGICTWPFTAVVNTYDPPRSIVIKGAGIDQTVIYDDVPTVNTTGDLFSISVPQEALFRLSGFTFKTGSNATQKYGGVVTISGKTKAFRIDHNKFDTKYGNGVVNHGCIYGVIDNNIFESTVRQATRVYHSSCGDGDNWGDVSAAAPLTLGTNRAIYLEDNIVKNVVMTDGYAAGRYVVRFNTISTSGIPIQNHGLESSGRIRGTLQWEVYNNKDVKLSPSNPFFHMRSGNGVIFNNTMTGSDYVTSLGSFNNYRSAEDFKPWRTCDGSGPFDLNELDAQGSPKVFDAGVHTGGVLIASSTIPEILMTTRDHLQNNQDWAKDQWVGWSLRRIKASPLTAFDVNISGMRSSLKLATIPLNTVVLSQLSVPLDSATDQEVIDALNILIIMPDLYTKAGDKFILPVDIQVLKQKAAQSTLTKNDLMRLNIGLLNAVYGGHVKGSWGSKIIANSACTKATPTCTIETAISSNNSSMKRIVETGDRFELTRAQNCMDQVGRSEGELISGGEVLPTPVGWVKSRLTPVFLWGNVLNGAANNNASGSASIIRKNREYYVDNNGDTVKCSSGAYDQYGLCTGFYTAKYKDDDGSLKDWTYKPYVYPHNLRTYGLTADNPDSPVPTKGSGDVSQDGKVTVFDAAMVLRYTMGSPLTDSQKEKADINTDSKIDSLDMILITKKALGL